jgi:hypothetical protein
MIPAGAEAEKNTKDVTWTPTPEKNRASLPLPQHMAEDDTTGVSAVYGLNAC